MENSPEIYKPLTPNMVIQDGEEIQMNDDGNHIKLKLQTEANHRSTKRNILVFKESN